MARGGLLEVLWAALAWLGLVEEVGVLLAGPGLLQRIPQRACLAELWCCWRPELIERPRGRHRCRRLALAHHAGRAFEEAARVAQVGCRTVVVDVAAAVVVVVVVLCGECGFLQSRQRVKRAEGRAVLLSRAAGGGGGGHDCGAVVAVATPRGLAAGTRCSTRCHVITRLITTTDDPHVGDTMGRSSSCSLALSRRQLICNMPCAKAPSKAPYKAPSMSRSHRNWVGLLSNTLAWQRSPVKIPPILHPACLRGAVASLVTSNSPDPLSKVLLTHLGVPLIHRT